MYKNNIELSYKQRNHNGIRVIPLLCCLGICIFGTLIMSGCSNKDEILIPVDEDSTGWEDIHGYTAGDTAEEYSIQNQESDVLATANNMSDDKYKADTCYVFVCGAVQNADVYELSQDEHIIDAIKAAGGFVENANESYINLAQKVTDGMKIYVPSIDENPDELIAKGLLDGSTSSNTSEKVSENQSAIQSDSQNSSSDMTKIKVNINIASESELMTIPGIGQSKASKIIAYRNQNGGFAQTSDIMKVDGIKNGMYDKIKEYISVE